jgi:hypothetical protein
LDGIGSGPSIDLAASVSGALLEFAGSGEQMRRFHASARASGALPGLRLLDARFADRDVSMEEIA